MRVARWLWLTALDDVPFADLPELFDTANAIATRPTPPRLPRRVIVEQRPEVEDWNIGMSCRTAPSDTLDTPLLAWRHSDAT